MCSFLQGAITQPVLSNFDGNRKDERSNKGEKGASKLHAISAERKTTGTDGRRQSAVSSEAKEGISWTNAGKWLEGNLILVGIVCDDGKDSFPWRWEASKQMAIEAGRWSENSTDLPLALESWRLRLLQIRSRIVCQLCVTISKRSTGSFKSRLGRFMLRGHNTYLLSFFACIFFPKRKVFDDELSSLIHHNI